MNAKATSVDVDGQPDGFEPPHGYVPQAEPGGPTRIVVSLPPDELPAAHRMVVEALEPPLKVLYVQLTDRGAGQLPKPRRYVGVELAAERVLEALECFPVLLYRDARHQFWVNDAQGAQVVLDELGLLYLYPDDARFRTVLGALQLSQAAGPTLAERDYVKVNFNADADGDEEALIHRLGLSHWHRG